MKHLIYIFSIILLTTCGESSNQGLGSTTKENQTFDTLKTYKESIDLDSMKSLKIFQDFALNYSPKRKPNSGVAMLPEPSDSILEAIKVIKNLHPQNFEKYLTLIFVKLYSAHLECCNQSYEIRRQPPVGLDKLKDPLVYEFNKITKKYSNQKRIEFIPSSIGYDYAISHKQLLGFEPIKKYLKLIEQVHKNLEERAYSN